MLYMCIPCRDEPEADAKGNVGPEGSPRPKGSAAGAGGPLSSGRTYTSKALAAQTDEESGMRATALALNSCATQDEALQVSLCAQCMHGLSALCVPVECHSAYCTMQAFRL